MRKETTPVPVLYGELMKNKTALITGGSQGIGFALAKAVIINGGNVIITGRNKEKLDKSREELKRISKESEVFVFTMDNTELETISQKFSEIVSMVSPLKIDVLVNNAGIGGGGCGYCSPEEYKKIMDTNLSSSFFLTEQVSRYFIKEKIKGNILNITSASDLRPATSAYQISKWGLKAFTMGMAKSLIPYGIVVNALAPGPVEHRMRANIGKSPSCPAGRYSTLEEIANLAIVLMSDLGRMIVGETLHCTGGAGNLTLDDVEYSFA